VVEWKRDCVDYVMSVRYRYRYRREHSTLVVLTSRSEGRSEGMRGSAAALMHRDVMRSRQDAEVEASVTSVT
jgi:hypothetical protein